MHDPCVINAVEGRMLSHRGFPTGGATSITDASQMMSATDAGTGGSARVFGMV